MTAPHAHGVHYDPALPSPLRDSGDFERSTVAKTSRRGLFALLAGAAVAPMVAAPFRLGPGL